MQKYTNGTEIRHFEDDVNVSDWIDLSKYRLMTNEEIFKHETPKPTKFHTEWNGTEWIDIRTEEEKLIYKRSQYSSLTRYQFLRCLLENGYKSEAIETQILTIEDEIARALTLLGFKEATNFVRTDESIIATQRVLGLSDEKVDELWEYAMKI